MKKLKIAISLICHNDEVLLKPCLSSLFESDINKHYLKLFCYDNNSNNQMKELLSSQTVDKWIYNSEVNDGIVIPRIKIYEEIIKEEFDFLLEIHSDMLFPKNWFENLYEIFDENTGIIEPHIYQPRSKGVISLEYFEEVLPTLLKDVKYDLCRQTHPWLINLKIVDAVGGYYDSIFSPQECEDDDFIFRVINNGYKVKSTGMSWVVHYGQSIRNQVLPSNLTEHIRKFSEKNNIGFNDFVNKFEIHPAYAY